MARHVSFPIFVLASVVLVSACATAPAATPEENALIARMEGKSLLPADAATMAALERADPFSRLDFWQGEFDKSPTNPAIAAELAKSYQRLGRYREAVGAANTALSLAPSHPGALYILAASLIADSRSAAAEPSLARLISDQPGNADARSLMGVVHDLAGRHDAARAEYRAALASDPTHRDAMVNLAMSFMLDGKPDYAETVLRESVNRPGSTAKTRQNLALALALQGKFDDAHSIALQDMNMRDADASIASIRSMIEGGQDWKTAVSAPKETLDREQSAAIASAVLRG
jgi:Flp pilus assembly protein TadD